MQAANLQPPSLSVSVQIERLLQQQQIADAETTFILLCLHRYSGQQEITQAIVVEILRLNRLIANAWRQ